MQKRYLHPVTYAGLASQVLIDNEGEPRGKELRALRRYTSRGIEAALVLALDLDAYVNPFHHQLSQAERDALHAAGH